MKLLWRYEGKLGEVSFWMMMMMTRRRRMRIWRESNLTSAWIILDQELVKCHPASSDTHHDCAAQDTHQTQLLVLTKLIT